MTLIEPVHADLEPGWTLDRLAGDWWIYQLARGHRYNTDDVLVAWLASTTRPRAQQVLDLGSGVGSVGLMTLLCLGTEARLTMVEAQAQSVQLARRTIAHNGLSGRVRLWHGDLREFAGGRYDLITANPPYLPPGTATPSPEPQRAAARIELLGNVFGYAGAAASLLSPAGVFCFCFAAADLRPLKALEEAGLVLLSSQEVVFRQGQRPTITLYTASFEGTTRVLPPLVVRDLQGQRTDAFRGIRRHLLIEA